jgi:hypothetical protein
MAYSTAAEIREWLGNFAETTRLPDATITQRIAQGDEILIVDLGNLIDFTAVDAAASTPPFINLLSEYKGAELTLVYLNGVNRGLEEAGDIKYFRDLYNGMVEKIRAGEIDTGDYTTGTNTFSNDYKTNVRPALGTDKYGQFETETDLENSRPLNDYSGISRGYD